MHVNIFLNQKIVDHIQVAIDRILSEVDLDITYTQMSRQLCLSPFVYFH